MGGALLSMTNVFASGRNCLEYFRCIYQKKGGNCKEKPIKLKDMEEQIVDYRGKLRITEKFHQWAIKNLKFPLIWCAVL